jgi:hypothetical protein
MGRAAEAFAHKLESALVTHMPDESAREEFRRLVEADVKAAADPKRHG